jgi:hypothetical protein
MSNYINRLFVIYYTSKKTYNPTITRITQQGFRSLLKNNKKLGSLNSIKISKLQSANYLTTIKVNL